MDFLDWDTVLLCYVGACIIFGVTFLYVFRDKRGHSQPDEHSKSDKWGEL